MGVNKSRNMEHSGTFRNILEHPGTGQIITKQMKKKERKTERKRLRKQPKNEQTNKQTTNKKERKKYNTGST